MIRLEDRQKLAQDIEHAQAAGARLKPACELAGINVHTLQCWKAGDGVVCGDGRPEAVHPTPAHALSEAERAQILRVANEPRFAEVPPARIVPMLADEGVYLVSRIELLSRAARRRADLPSRARASAAAVSPTDHACG